MINEYFTIKFLGFIIIIALFILYFLIVLLRSFIYSTKNKLIKKYLLSLGYKRELISTASVGNNHTYGYKRITSGGRCDIICDYELVNLSVKQIKKKYK